MGDCSRENDPGLQISEEVQKYKFDISPHTHLLSPCCVKCVGLFVWLQFGPLYPLAWPHAHCDPTTPNTPHPPTFPSGLIVAVQMRDVTTEPSYFHHSLTHRLVPQSTMHSLLFIEVVAIETQSIPTQFSTKHR